MHVDSSVMAMVKETDVWKELERWRIFVTRTRMDRKVIMQ